MLLTRVRLLPAGRVPENVRLPTVSVVIPLANKAESLPKLLASLREQSIAPHEVIVMCDELNDETNQATKVMGAVAVATPPLPHGWNSKSWACWNGAQRATGQLLVFLDADVVPSFRLIERLLLASAKYRGLISAQPYRGMDHMRERLAAFVDLIPVMTTGLGSLIPVKKTRFAFGSCMACRRKDYFISGGHEAVRSSKVEDIALARKFSARGLGVSAFGGRGAIEIEGQRLKESSRNLAAQTLAGSFTRVVGTLFWLVGISITGVLAILWLLGFQRGFLIPVAVALVVTQLWIMQRQQGNYGPGSALAFPITLPVFAGLFFLSVFRKEFKPKTPQPSERIPATTSSEN